MFGPSTRRARRTDASAADGHNMPRIPLSTRPFSIVFGPSTRRVRQTDASAADGHNTPRIPLSTSPFSIVFGPPTRRVRQTDASGRVELAHRASFSRAPIVWAARPMTIAITILIAIRVLTRPRNKLLSLSTPGGSRPPEQAPFIIWTPCFDALLPPPRRVRG